MTFTTENAAEMRAKRGRPPAAATITAPHMQPAEAPASAAPVAPRVERMIPLVLKTGWWPFNGTKYYAEVGRDYEDRPIMEQRIYETPLDERGQVDEMARKRLKFESGTRIEVPASVARVLTSGGKATLDDSL